MDLAIDLTLMAAALKSVRAPSTALVKVPWMGF